MAWVFRSLRGQLRDRSFRPVIRGTRADAGTCVSRPRLCCPVGVGVHRFRDRRLRPTDPGPAVRHGTTLSTPLVLDTLNQTIWTRTRTDASLESVGPIAIGKPVHVAAVRGTARRRRHQPVGTPWATCSTTPLAETINGLCKTELIRPRGPGRPSRSPPPNGSTDSTGHTGAVQVLVSQGTASRSAPAWVDDCRSLRPSASCLQACCRARDPSVGAGCCACRAGCLAAGGVGRH